jgi:hypothetical protein
MKTTMRSWGFLALLLALPAAAEQTGEPGGLLKRAANVDKPIPETYEPLNSTYVGDGERLNQTIEQSWQLKRQAREQQAQEAAAADSAERRALEGRIQEPGQAPAAPAEPRVVDTGKRLEIRGE